jgi:uncharacterized protein (DUF1330 family)
MKYTSINALDAIEVAWLSCNTSNKEEPVKTNYKLAIALIAGAAIGGAAIQGLHAQAKPPAYVIAEIDVTNQDAFAKEFTPLAVKALQDGGGKSLTRGGKTLSLEGAPPKSRITINAFESMEKAQAAFTSAAYKEARKIGDKYATFRIFVVEGVAQ